MSAPTRPTGPRTAAGADARLRWWALALPVLAFCLLLLLPAGTREAQASTGDTPHLLQVGRELMRAAG
ncbi:hypothetical protein [Streptomyces toxytricini]|uniref:Uncharacterized protein n=1 Tax=Streptomyces toxytricini TaxID=67369 RepID=A0ABW8EQ62_STRT5